MTVQVLVLAAHDGALLDHLAAILHRTIQGSECGAEIIESLDELIHRNSQQLETLASFLRGPQSASSRPCSSQESCRSRPGSSQQSHHQDNGSDLEAQTAQLLKRIHKRDKRIKALSAEIQQLQSELEAAQQRGQQIEAEQEQFFEDVQHMKEAYDTLHASHQKLLWEYLPGRDADLAAIPKLCTSSIVETEHAIGPYTLQDVLGYGQYAVVYAATTGHSEEQPQQEALANRLAVKSIDKEKLVDLVALCRVSSEIAVLRDPAVQHAGIVALRDVIHTQRHIYLVTERGGRDLFECFGPREDGLNESTMRTVMHRVALAVETLHRREYCHRDLKPENILFAPEHPLPAHRVKLVDFGLCTKAVSPQQAMLHDFCGSPGFFAPEILLDERYDGRRADMWSLGCILLELILGSTRFSSLWMPMYDVNTLKDRAKFAGLVHSSVQAAREFCFGSQWAYSEALRDLLLSILREDPVERLTIREMLGHPWLASEVDASPTEHPQTETTSPRSSESPRHRAHLAPPLPQPAKADTHLPGMKALKGASESRLSPTGPHSPPAAASRPRTSELAKAERRAGSSPHVSALASAAPAGDASSHSPTRPTHSPQATSSESPELVGPSPSVTLPSLSPDKPSSSRSPDKSFARRPATHTHQHHRHHQQHPPVDEQGASVDGASASAPHHHAPDR
ncbi:hypothetical protein P43SY_008906 [Pythium insidiosum]|uniref:Protein kinase domain-containing protein n=1 Tax=Pythium insidiosum TaxID=114742 RepID=A0AAD5LYD2_PYTIN|nr:hypothetical protein P43SY_008906 [Pythium insidiosum]